MGWVSGTALFFIIWWVVLFTVLPIGVRSQAEEGDITFGTDHGAPVRPAIFRKILLTTGITIVLFGLYYLVTVVWGLSFQDFPRIVPQYQRG